MRARPSARTGALRGSRLHRRSRQGQQQLPAQAVAPPGLEVQQQQLGARALPLARLGDQGDDLVQGHRRQVGEVEDRRGGTGHPESLDVDGVQCASAPDRRSRRCAGPAPGRHDDLDDLRRVVHQTPDVCRRVQRQSGARSCAEQRCERRGLPARCAVAGHEHPRVQPLPPARRDQLGQLLGGEPGRGRLVAADGALLLARDLLGRHGARLPRLAGAAGPLSTGSSRLSPRPLPRGRAPAVTARISRGTPDPGSGVRNSTRATRRPFSCGRCGGYDVWGPRGAAGGGGAGPSGGRYSQPRCWASRAASTRVEVPVLPMAEDR